MFSDIFSYIGLTVACSLRDPDLVMNRANLLRPDVPVRLPYVQVGVVILSLCLPKGLKLPRVQTEAARLEGAPTLRVVNSGLARSRAFQTTLE